MFGICVLKTGSFRHRYGRGKFDYIGGDGFTKDARPYEVNEDDFFSYRVWMPEYQDTVLITKNEFEKQFNIVMRPR